MPTTIMATKIAPLMARTIRFFFFSVMVIPF
jgi:hypothetical protein